MSTPKKVKKAYPPPTEEMKQRVFKDSMIYELLHTFGVPEGLDDSDYFHWELVNFTRMGHARLLHKFFETSLENRYQDDVLAADFGFAPQKTLTQEEWDRLNKDLLHFSFGRLRHDNETKKWPSNIIGSLLAPALEFMELVKGRRELFANDHAQCFWANLMDRLRSGRELFVRAHLVDGCLRYHIREGQSLPHGKPALTAWCSETYRSKLLQKMDSATQMFAGETADTMTLTASEELPVPYCYWQELDPPE